MTTKLNFSLDDFIHCDKLNIAVEGADVEEAVTRLCDQVHTRGLEFTDVERGRVEEQIRKRLRDPALRISVLPELCEITTPSEPDKPFYAWAFTIDHRVIYRELGGRVIDIPVFSKIMTLNACETYQALNDMAKTSKQRAERMKPIFSLLT